jgi:putative intracellular protease/amidase
MPQASSPTPRPTAHLAVYDGSADGEVGHLLAELHSGRFTGTRFRVVTVAESREPITTMGGLRVTPDTVIGDLDPADSTAGAACPAVQG